MDRVIENDLTSLFAILKDSAWHLKRKKKQTYSQSLKKKYLQKYFSIIFSVTFRKRISN